jgi:hypothetical protein
LILGACTTLLERDLRCIIAQATQVVKLESTLLGEREDVFVSLAWVWVHDTPTGEAVIINRSMDDSTNFTPIDTIWDIDSVMYYTDSASVLQAGSIVFYKLGLLDGSGVEYFRTFEVNVPGSQHFYEPSVDTLTDTLLHITFRPLEDFNSCSVAVYKGFSTDPESLVNFIDPLFDTLMTYPDTTVVVSMADTIVYPDATVYTIKLFTSNSIFTRISVGFRAFLKLPL